MRENLMGKELNIMKMEVGTRGNSEKVNVTEKGYIITRMEV